MWCFPFDPILKSIRVFPAAFAFFGATIVFGYAVESTVLTDGNGNSVPIVISEDAPPHTIEAAEELRRLILKISGSQPEILKGFEETSPSSAIWVGPHPALEKVLPGVNFSISQPEETLIVVKAGHVVLLGKDKIASGKQVMSGTANAVYSFAQNSLGVRWLWPGELGEDVLANKRITVPDQVTRYSPIFWQRDLFYRVDEGAVGLWLARQRLMYDSYETPKDHTFYEWWDKYSKDHPEYFALQPDGTRSGFPKPNLAKICEGEPGVWKQWLENVVEERKANPTKFVFGASQNDSSNAGICVDPRSQAWDHPDAPLQQYHWAGSYDTYVAMSDRMVHFANQLGKMLEERFPNEGLQVAVMAYGPSKTAPVEEVAQDNVIISYVGQFPTSGDKWREMEKAQFAAWSKKAKSMAFRPNLFYYSGGWHGLPVISPRTIGEDFKFLADHNCRAITVDGVPNHYGTQGLQYYIMAQLMWDPYQNVNAIVDDFCQRGFGPAAPKVRAYYDLMEQAHDKVANHPAWFPGMATTRDPLSENILPEAYSPEVLAKADVLLAEAAQSLAGEAKIYVERLEFLQRAQEFTRLMMETLVTMNEVRRSEGKNYVAVEKANQLVEAREAFFEKEKLATRDGRRPPAVGAHRIRTTWIESRKLQDWLGPVNETFQKAAVEAKKLNLPIVQSWKRNSEPEVSKLRFARPATYRWTGAAGDQSWQNKANWEAMLVSSAWAPAPAPPDSGAKVELGDAVLKSGPQTIQLVNDVTLEAISFTAENPKNTYRIEDRPDVDGGIDADSSRLNIMTLTGGTPLRQANNSQANVDIDVVVKFQATDARKDLRSSHGAKVRLLKNKE